MATITDVARKAGVAISTVSNIINGTRNVSPETTQKVLQVIEELGYETDPVARNMKSSRSSMIGVIITNYRRVFFAPILRHCREIAAAQGYNLMCIESNDDFSLEKEYVKIMRNNRFDAIILDSVAELDNEKYFHYLRTLSTKGKRIAVVCIERDASMHGLDSVEADNYMGACGAMDHLLSFGCKSILHITGPMNSWPAERRAQGYCDRIAAAPGLKQHIVFGDFSPKSGYDAVKKALLSNMKLPFDGIFSSNDQMAIGAMKALKELRVGVPDDVKVVGFDDSFVASLIEPSLTSVHVSGSSIGSEAMRMALERIADFSRPARCWKIETGLVVRKSTDRNAYIAQDFVNW